MTALAITAYSGPAPLTLASAWTSWTFDIGGAVMVGFAGWAYLRGLRRLRSAGERWPPTRTLWFFLGLVVLALTTMSFLGAYAHTLFWVTAAQTALLLTVVPVLLVLGGPVALLVRASPAWQPRVERMLASAPARFLTFPLIGSVLVAAIPFTVYYTPWFEASLRWLPVYWLLHLVLLAVGLVFFWSVLSVDRPPRVHHVALTVIVLAETLFDAVPGIALWLGRGLIAPDYYRAVGRPWGRSLLSDQQFGGVVLWAIGELVGIPLLLLVVLSWVRTDAAEAARIDAELDRADLERADRDRAQAAELADPQMGIDRNGEA